MTALNHAMTGALIGLTVSNPVLALPLAFLSHFACDAIPHYDMAEQDMGKRIGSTKFLYQYIFIPGALCLLLVLCLAITRPTHWLIAALCAFLAASPDLFWIPRFIHVKRTGKDAVSNGWFFRMHHRIQWKTGPKFIWLEIAWFIGFGCLLARYL